MEKSQSFQIKEAIIDSSSIFHDSTCPKQSQSFQSKEAIIDKERESMIAGIISECLSPFKARKPL
jgi:hypothetical protein